MAILSTSRFFKTSLVLTRDGKETYGRMDGFDSIKNINGDNFTFYTVPNELEGRADLIADNFYGDSHLEWVLVIANAAKNPLNWPKSGEVIKVPDEEFVRSTL